MAKGVERITSWLRISEVVLVSSICIIISFGLETCKSFPLLLEYRGHIGEVVDSILLAVVFKPAVFV